MYRVLVVFEQGENNYSAYAPDIPGCIATGRTKEETQENMRSALAMHIKGMIEDGEAVPPLDSMAMFIEVPLPEADL